MKRLIMTSATCILLVGPVYASDSLSCRIKQSGVEGAGFSWTYARPDEEAPGPHSITTSIGTVSSAEGPRYTTALTLNGRPIALPAQYAGVIRFGKIFEFDGGVALAYLVARWEDSQASPSRLVVQLNKAGKPVETQLLPGDNEDANFCDLLS